MNKFKKRGKSIPVVRNEFECGQILTTHEFQLRIYNAINNLKPKIDFWLQS